MHALSPRRTLLAAISAVGLSVAFLGAPGGAVDAAAPAATPAQAPAATCVDLSCLSPMTEQARLAQFAGVQAIRMGADSAGALRAGIETKNALARAAAVPGTNGTWSPLG